MNTRPQIEHAAGNIGAGNSHILDTLTVAYRAALQLAEDGFTVLNVEIAGRNPRIWIQNCGRCARLKGVTTITRNAQTGREYVMVAYLHGAQVQWVSRSH